jgi:hypothetical protein
MNQPVHQTGSSCMHEGLHDDEASSASAASSAFLSAEAAHGASPPGRAGRYAFDLISLCPDLLVQTISGVIPLYFSSDLTS